MATDPDRAASEIGYLSSGQVFVYALICGVWLAAAATFILGKIIEAFSAQADDFPPAAGRSMLEQSKRWPLVAGSQAAAKIGFPDKPDQPGT
jgi:hypothetical protein